MSFASDYNAADKLLHYIAFALPSMQKILCEMENDVYGKEINAVNTKDEVFVTGLPRSGTTLVLEMLYRTGEFTTYTYRNMPFILAPLFWAKVSNYFQKDSVAKERAHGDGMQVSFDSPEAFEEIIWLAYMKGIIVKKDCLVTLSASDCSELFIEAFRKSIKKLIYLNRKNSEEQAYARYLSKNNANISRVNAITKIFPNSIVVIPFRNPVSHVGSLQNQHERFGAMHKLDSFSRHYMKWLGHFEFGENFKPINFNNWLEAGRSVPEFSKDNWLEYWVNAYQYILDNMSERIFLVDFDRLLSEGGPYLGKIADSVGITNKASMLAEERVLHTPTKYPDNISEYSGVC